MGKSTCVRRSYLTALTRKTYNQPEKQGSNQASPEVGGVILRILSLCSLNTCVNHGEVFLLFGGKKYILGICPIHLFLILYCVE